MSDYDYGNARLRAMKSLLLFRREVEALAEVNSMEGLISALIKTPYRRPVEAALARGKGLESVADALRNDLVETVGKLRSFYDGEAKEAVSYVLRSYDVHNLKAILRGLSRNALPGEIMPTLLPVGDLAHSILSDLARAPGPRGAIDLLASMGLPFAQPLLKLRALRPGAETFEMELMLEKWRDLAARRFFQQRSRSMEVALEALNLDADLVNLLTTLRFIQFPSEQKLLKEKLGTEDRTILFLGPGNLSFDQLSRAGSETSLSAFVDDLADTVYGRSLKAGLEAFTQSGRLSEFERQLKLYRLGWNARQIVRDPLGIGVVLGFLALKTSEIRNLQWIAQGINTRMKAEVIRAELEFVP